MQKALYTFEDLLKLLQDDGVMHQPDRPTRTVHIPTEIGPHEGLMLLRWLEHEGVLQLVHSMPFIVPHRMRSTFIEALNQLNHAMTLSGFALHPQQGLPYYRRELPISPRGWIFDEEVRWWFGTSVDVVTTCAPALQRLAAGELDVTEFLEDSSLDITRLFRPPVL